MSPLLPQDAAYPDPAMAQQAPMGAPMAQGPPPETLDGPQAPMGPQVGVSLDPVQMAQIALQVVAEMAGIDLQAFQQGQQQAMAEVPSAIQAIMAQLQMQAQAPETLDGPVAPPGPATTLPQDPQGMGMMG